MHSGIQAKQRSSALLLAILWPKNCFYYNKNLLEVYDIYIFIYTSLVSY